MSVVWSISVAGADPVPASSLGIEGMVIERVNLDVSTLGFRIPSASADYAATLAGNPPIASGAAVVLYRDGVVWFTGRADPPSLTFGQGKAAAWSYLIANAWRRLERIVYQQYFFHRTSPTEALTLNLSPRVTLGQDAWGRKITVTEQINAILAFAGVGGGGSLGSIVSMPIEEAANITCAEAILRQLRWAPDAVGHFGNGSSLSITRRAALAAVSLDLDEADPAQPRVEIVTPLRKRTDLVPAGVVFVFRRYEDNADGDPVPRYTFQSAGATTGEGVVTATIELANQGGTQAEAIPPDAASSYYAALATAPLWTGEIIIRERECSGAVTLANKVNLLGGHADWATMAAPIQSITEEIDTGTTRVRLGGPALLSPEDFVSMLQFVRAKLAPNGWSAVQHNGTEGGGDLGAAPDVDPGDQEANPEAGDASAAEPLAQKVIDSLRAASFTAECDGTDTNMTMNLPGLPP